MSKKKVRRQQQLPVTSRPNRGGRHRKIVFIVGLLLLLGLSGGMLARWRAARMAANAKAMLASRPAPQPDASPLQLSKEYIYAGGKLVATEEPGTNPTPTPTPTPPAATASATFIKTDTTTKGTWSGVYGSEGYEVVNNASSYPYYAQASVSGQAAYTWASSTSEARALQKATNTADRLAATWYSSSNFTIDLNLNDAFAHRVTLYCLDWDGGGARSQTIEILDATTNQILNSQSVTSFTEGKYLVWNIRGHVKIKLTYTGQAGYSAVVSGLFFDTAVYTNVALASSGSTATASSSLDNGRLPIAAINGDRKGEHWGSDPATGSGWHDATTGYPDWLEINFNGSKIITSINVFTIQDNYDNPVEPTKYTTFTAYGITAFQVQYWNGSAWVDVPGGNVVGNNKIMRQFLFPAITTGKIRVLVNNSLSSSYPYSRIIEVEAWGQS
jgi:hypothetical protein